MIDRKHIGHVFEAHTHDVEKGRLRFFAKATGQTDPVYVDEDAAKQAGYPSLPVPPTFFRCLESEVPDPWAMLKLLDIDIGKLLHGEQKFTYHEMVFAGDALTFQAKISDIFDKKNGALEFVISDTRVSNRAGRHVADMRAVLVVRHG